jgi:hypothetical protein
MRKERISWKEHLMARKWYQPEQIVSVLRQVEMLVSRTGRRRIRHAGKPELWGRPNTAGIRSTEGHVVVRVAPGGETFQIVVTDDSDRIKLVSDPYGCKRKVPLDHPFRLGPGDLISHETQIEHNKSIEVGNKEQCHDRGKEEASNLR